jgi:hypothetical protein
MKNLDFPIRPQTVSSATGEVLIGGEVDDLRKGDGLNRAKVGGQRKRKIRRSKANLSRESAADLVSPANSPVKAPTVAIPREEFESRLEATKPKPIRLITVVPRLCGKPSPSYIVRSGEVVAKPRLCRRKKKRNRSQTRR